MPRAQISEIERCCWPGCKSDRYEDPASPPFCGSHLIECATFIAHRMGIILLDPSPEYQAKVAAEAERSRARAAVVYYIRVGRHVKIGTTFDLRTRLHALGRTHVAEDFELLGYERGGYGPRETEAQRVRDRAGRPAARALQSLAPAPRPHRSAAANRATSTACLAHAPATVHLSGSHTRETTMRARFDRHGRWPTILAATIGVLMVAAGDAVRLALEHADDAHDWEVDDDD